jgi:hypothetical protein
MVTGMAAGIVVVTWVWWTDAAAWTWYSAVGVAATTIVAFTASITGR